MPSNDMIERVARAIYADLPIGHAEARACARAAIEAMREPTPEMVKAGLLASCLDPNDQTNQDTQPLVWQAMLSAALHPIQNGEGE